MRAGRPLLALPCVALSALAAACGGTGSATPTTTTTATSRAPATTTTASSQAPTTTATSQAPTTTATSRAPTTTATSRAPTTAATSRAPTTTATAGASSTAVPKPPAPATSGLAALQEVAWKSVSVPGDVCPGRTAPIRLSGGRATIPAPRGVHAPTGVTVTEAAHDFGDLYGPGHDVAAVNVWCSAAKGTAASELQDSWVLYTDAGGKVRSLATLTPQQPSNLRKTAPHVPYFDTSSGGIAIAPGSVTVRELWYRAHDRTCCPSEHVTTVWRAHGSSFSSYTAITY